MGSKCFKKKFYAGNKPIKIGDLNVDNIVISKLVKTKTNSKYCIRYLDKVIKPLILIMPNMLSYVKHLKLKKEIKIKTIN